MLSRSTNLRKDRRVHQIHWLGARGETRAGAPATVPFVALFLAPAELGEKALPRLQQALDIPVRVAGHESEHKGGGAVATRAVRCREKNFE